MSHVISCRITKFILFKDKFQVFLSYLVNNFLKLLQMFILSCCMSNNIIINVENTVNVMSDIYRNKRLFGTKN